MSRTCPSADTPSDHYPRSTPIPVLMEATSRATLTTKKGATYSVGDNEYVVGLIRLQGGYENGTFVPLGHEHEDLSTNAELGALCNQTFPSCNGDGWAEGDTGEWFGLRADPFDERDKVHELPIPSSLPQAVDLRGGARRSNSKAPSTRAPRTLRPPWSSTFEKRSSGSYIEVSRLFLYKATRNLAQQTGDVGANTRSTMKALTMLGVPPEKYWPYDEKKVDDEPPAFCYALADRYRATEYHRVDTPDRPKELVLSYVRQPLPRIGR